MSSVVSVDDQWKQWLLFGILLVAYTCAEPSPAAWQCDGGGEGAGGKGEREEEEDEQARHEVAETGAAGKEYKAYNIGKSGNFRICD
jgi:hypothetical protein